MKLAITSTGNTLSHKIDPRFGRCSYFVIFDTETRSTDFLSNPYKNAKEGVGPSCVKLMSKHGISKIVSGEFGIKIKPLLDELSIQMIVIKDPECTIQHIINLIKHQK
jgi:predicted Fe-Mo cluster-binding NifX family protein